ncbi:MAG: response regulator [Bacteroidota bacterium]
MGKILVAEDSLIVNEHIVHALKSGGHDAVSVYSGREAVDLALKHRPDLILMDIMMESQSDGIDAAFKIKDTIDLPIIFLTALTDEPTINKAKTSLPYGYVVKPFNEAELLSNIDVALYKASAEKKIKENNELFQAIINAIDKAIFLLDSSGKIKYTNSIGEKITNQSFDVLMNAPIQNFLQFFDKDGNQVEDIYSIEDYKNDRLYLKDREEIYGDCYTQIVELESIYHLFIFKDITEQVKIREAKESLKTKRLSIFIEGQEKERERIARDLHDGVGQIANMIKLAVKQGDRGEGLLKMINQFLEEMRKLTNGLLPLPFVDFPIEVCIKKVVEQANNASEINFSFQAQDVPDNLDLKCKVNLYRIVQENLSNIIKHSKAENASVQLYGFDDFMQMTIEDDGIGFKSGHYDDNDAYRGIQNMMLRAEALHAECDLESNVGEGTFVLIKIPLHGEK